MRVGIFGGTFNPVHNGHLHIAKLFSQSLGLDRVIFVPSKKPTHKAAEKLACAADRLAMCQLAVQGTTFAVSDMEITRASESYTVYTLEAIHALHPEDTLYLLMGEDMFVTLLDWKNAPRILELAVACVAPRSENGWERLKAYGEQIVAAGGTYRIVQIPFLPISSTEIRCRIQQGKSIRTLVPKQVDEYIQKHALYRGGTDQ